MTLHFGNPTSYIALAGTVPKIRSRFTVQTYVAIYNSSTYTQSCWSRSTRTSTSVGRTSALSGQNDFNFFEQRRSIAFLVFLHLIRENQTIWLNNLAYTNYVIAVTAVPRRAVFCRPYIRCESRWAILQSCKEKSSRMVYKLRRIEE